MLNYARNKDSGEYVFFEGPLVPAKCVNIGRWAFWRVPSGTDPSRFGGQLIGEDPHERCIRLRHRPKERQCNVCKPAKALADA